MKPTPISWPKSWKKGQVLNKLFRWNMHCNMVKHPYLNKPFKLRVLLPQSWHLRAQQSNEFITF